MRRPRGVRRVGPGAREPCCTPSRAMRQAQTGFLSICGPSWTTPLARDPKRRHYAVTHVALAVAEDGRVHGDDESLESCGLRPCRSGTRPRPARSRVELEPHAGRRPPTPPLPSARPRACLAPRSFPWPPPPAQPRRHRRGASAARARRARGCTGKSQLLTPRQRDRYVRIRGRRPPCGAGRTGRETHLRSRAWSARPRHPRRRSRTPPAEAPGVARSRASATLTNRGGPKSDPQLQVAQ